MNEHNDIAGALRRYAASHPQANEGGESAAVVKNQRLLPFISNVLGYHNEITDDGGVIRITTDDGTVILAVAVPSDLKPVIANAPELHALWHDMKSVELAMIMNSYRVSLYAGLDGVIDSEPFLTFKVDTLDFDAQVNDAVRALSQPWFKMDLLTLMADRRRLDLALDRGLDKIMKNIPREMVKSIINTLHGHENESITKAKVRKYRPFVRVAFDRWAMAGEHHDRIWKKLDERAWIHPVNHDEDNADDDHADALVSGREQSADEVGFADYLTGINHELGDNDSIVCHTLFNKAKFSLSRNSSMTVAYLEYSKSGMRLYWDADMTDEKRLERAAITDVHDARRYEPQLRAAIRQYIGKESLKLGMNDHPLGSYTVVGKTITHTKDGWIVPAGTTVPEPKEYCAAIVCERRDLLMADGGIKDGVLTRPVLFTRAQLAAGLATGRSVSHHEIIRPDEDVNASASPTIDDDTTIAADVEPARDVPNFEHPASPAERINPFLS